MAKIEYITEKTEDNPESVERIEVRVWGPGAKAEQMFVVGSGANFRGSGTLVLEIIYSVNGVQFFYTRNYLQFEGDAEDARKLEKYLERFQRGEVDGIGMSDMLPATFIRLERKKHSYRDWNGDDVLSQNYRLEIGADVGAVIGNTDPGIRMIDISLESINVEEGVRFMRDLIHEVIAVYEGKHPNPADLPEGSSDWSFVRQLNQKAYDIVAKEYEENYFSNPVLTGIFDAWLRTLPSGGHILDAGCGHGNPVISRLLEKGFQVTGTDISAKMLERARAQFPRVPFLNQFVSDLRSEMEFDGACSFSSLLYLDPIDLSHSIHRLYRALKPGGYLFLYAHDLHPDSRGNPYGVDLNQWMWTWSHGMSEVGTLLEEFGYFKVLEMKDVTSDEEKEKRIESWRKSELEQRDKMIKSLPPETHIHIPPLDLSKVPSDLAYAYVIVARKAE